MNEPELCDHVKKIVPNVSQVVVQFRSEFQVVLEARLRAARENHHRAAAQYDLWATRHARLPLATRSGSRERYWLEQAAAALTAADRQLCAAEAALASFRRDWS